MFTPNKYIMNTAPYKKTKIPLVKKQTIFLINDKKDYCITVVNKKIYKRSYNVFTV